MRLDVDIKSGFFTSREVAEGLGISLRTLKNYRDEGRIQYHKFSPRRIGYAKQHIWAFLQTTHCSFYMKERAKKLLQESIVKYNSPE
ncbi:helix-turn-helix domain-containing protein [Alistipes finegoldii]|uniref:helix-turn-helix domain-containing protein n=1 Tax=Alistipes finegoldii TaxID=214856 RepID=UPI00338F9F59